LRASFKSQLRCAIPVPPGVNCTANVEANPDNWLIPFNIQAMSTQGPPKRRVGQVADKPVKRTRVSRACDQCRLAREKCNGTQPTCSTCSTTRRACTYTANVKKRGIQPGYIRALELALAYLFQHDPSNEILVNDKLAQGGPASLLLSRDSKESNKLHRRWRKARFYTDVDKLLSGGETSRHDQSEPLSSDSEEEKSMMQGPTSIVASQAQTSTQVPHGQTSFYGPPHPLPTPMQSAPASASRLSIPSDSWRLLEVYFTYSQAWLPICSKQDALRTLYSYPTEGLSLSASHADSGQHAELWSILAVAVMHDTVSSNSHTPQRPPAMAPAQLYATTKSLIPDEVGRFELGHVRALLNLAVVNAGCSSTQAAWLLVGYASRVLQVLNQSVLVGNPDYKHVLQGCFLLDIILGNYLGKHSYLQANEVKAHGRLDEDGLDEWQPWNGGLDASASQQPRTPTMGPSSFNNTLELVVLLDGDKESVSDRLQLLEQWEASLTAKMAFIRAPNPSETLTPATVLVRTTYHCANLALRPSDSWLLQSLELLEQAQTQIGWRKLPPFLRYYFEIIHRCSARTSSSRVTQDRLGRLKTAMKTAWPDLQDDEMAAPHSTLSDTTIQTSTPFSARNSPDEPAFVDSALTSSSRFDHAPIDLQPVATLSPKLDTMLNLSPAVQIGPQYQQMPSDLESFFDELASLDTANNSDNQPQFMQNLGFAPDANMADLFSEYIPMSTAFMSQDNNGGVNFDSYGFYERS
jgi:hypothetical protein